ncbi:heavy metal translocating P-type ATPase [Marinospirillum insulare]|uniref:Copper-translocating P-type ATPase n=1 Tax=Marinospirillum insulare TaxID=217169 RepID=A0ABQ6A130_9GAMM|nr:cation-translocating P-type ATPase [Marinospirillum insulare]GLR64621.1 copper-translocating P-type ATPase [Marinospirillum insulare]
MSLLEELEDLTPAGRAVFSIGGMWCASCARAIEKTLIRVVGIESAQINFTAASALITWNPQRVNFHQLVQRVEALGYSISPWLTPKKAQQSLKKQTQKLSLQLAIAVVFGMWSMLGSWVLYLSSNPFEVEYNLALTTLLLALPVVLYSGLDFYRAAFNTLRLGIAGMDAFISLGVWGSVIISVVNLSMGKTDVYLDAATMLITFLLLGRLIEIKAKTSSQKAIQALEKLSPETATRLVFNQQPASPTQEELAVSELSINDLVLVKAGERLAVDGLVEKGTSLLNNALLTGEFQPQKVAAGQLVYAGAINLTAPLEVRVVTATNKRRIDLLGLRMLELFSGRSTLAATAEKFVSLLFPITLSLALAALVYYLAIGQAFSQAILGSLSILVAACPCAVGMALPLAYALASYKAAQQGVVWKDPASIENLAQAEIMAFDKTGTLTLGKLQVTHLTLKAGWQAAEVAQFLLLVEAGNAHPLAEAITNYATAKLTKDNIPPLENENPPQIFSQGVALELANNQGPIHLGSHAWLSSLGVKDLPSLNPAEVYLSYRQEWIATLKLTDSLRPEAKGFLEGLVKEYGLDIWLMTGDSTAAAKALIDELKINFDQVVTHASPEEKAQIINKLPRNKLAFVGDGANDALVLASASAGIAMPGASSVAVAAAGVVITQDERGLEALAASLKLAKKFYRLVKQNLFFAVIYNLGVISLFFVLGVTPLAAAIAMLLSSLSVLLNTLRLIKN